jgi:CRP-like cAMP-binding protein
MSNMDETHKLIERAANSADEARRVASETHEILRKSREIKTWTARVQGRAAEQIENLVSQHSRGNLLLGSLPIAEFQRLLPRMQEVRFKARQVLHHAGSPIDHVYFPASGLLSAVLRMRDGNSIEVSSIGHEGMAGLSACIGNKLSPFDVVVQIPGEGLRIDIPFMQQVLKQDGAMYGLLTDYQSVSAVQAAYQVACNGLHTVERRCCRRLLTVGDRTGWSVLPLTHESLALSLGVRRATVTDGLGQLQSRGVIKCLRGQIEVLDRPQLQSLACECYQAIHDEYARLFESAGGDGPSAADAPVRPDA